MILKFRHTTRIIHSFVLLFLFGQLQAKAPVLNDKQLASPPPRIIRTCCSFGANMGFVGIPFAKKTDITSPAGIGPHVYLGGRSEKNGNIYTRRGGFLDFGHLRDCADWTAYLYQLITTSKENKGLTFINLGNEGGSKTLLLNIPDNITKEETIQLAGKIAYDLSVWHEISTWFGASYVPLVPERFSSFSPEDLYSNLMGVHVGMKAIRSDLDYNEAMTVELAKMLEELEAVTTEQETYDAMVMVDQQWYTSQKRLPNKKILLKRFLDSGSELTPWLVPELESLEMPYVLVKPAEYLSDFYKLEIKLNFKFPVKNIFPDQEDRMITQNDFEIFIDYIQNDLDELQAKEENRANRIAKRNEERGKTTEITDGETEKVF